MPQETLQAVDPRGLRHTFGSIASGFAVVTTQAAGGTPQGAAVSAFTAVSLDPPLAQVTVTRRSRAARYLEGAPFAINILSLEQLPVALFFAGKAPGEPEWTLAGGVPVLTRNAATLECRPWNIFDGGDHLIVVGEVTGHSVTGREPLLSLGGGFHHTGRPVEGTGGNHQGTSAGPGWSAGAGSFTPLRHPGRL